MAALRAETRARALALQLLYGWDLAGAGADRAGREAGWARVVGCLGARPRVQERSLDLASRATRRVAELDSFISAAADRWRMERLGCVDRNVLRLAVLELLEGETPPRVVIDEAVRLARWFGGEKSPGFVNGVLDRVGRDLGRL
jgi:N utilization substance protein B